MRLHPPLRDVTLGQVLQQGVERRDLLLSHLTDRSGQVAPTAKTKLFDSEQAALDAVGLGGEIFPQLLYGIE